MNYNNSEPDDHVVDLEHGIIHRNTAPGHSHSMVDAVVTILAAFACLSFGIAWYHEACLIQSLKLHYSTIDPCHAIESSFSFWDVFVNRMSQLQQECARKREIEATPSIPNPLTVFINLLWRSFIGDDAIPSISFFISSQTYIVQVVLTVSATFCLTLLVYNCARDLTAHLTASQQLQKPKGQHTQLSKATHRRQLSTPYNTVQQRDYMTIHRH